MSIHAQFFGPRTGSTSAARHDNGNMITTTPLLGLSWIALSAIYRCDLPGEPVLFADRPCPNGVIIELRQPPTMHSVALTDADLAVVLGTAAKPVAQTARQSRHQRDRTTSTEAKACADAKADLRAIQMKRRKGYSLAEGVRLEGQAAKHRDTIRENCGP